MIEIVREHYNAYPFPGRLNAYGPWAEQAPGLLSALGLDPCALRGARVLDAGCGTGEYARSRANLGARVTAIDISTGALAAARALDRELEIPEIDYRVADVLGLPPGESFDYIFSLGVLHHTASPELGFRNLAARVAPGGHLIVGLYSSVSRIHILTLRRLLRAASGNDQERAIDLAQRWCRPFLHLFIGDRARVADLLAHPHERPTSVHTAVRWFEQRGFRVLKSTPSIDSADYPHIARLARNPDSALAHLLIQLQWLRWNADYYVLAGQYAQ